MHSGGFETFFLGFARQKRDKRLHVLIVLQCGHMVRSPAPTGVSLRTKSQSLVIELRVCVSPPRAFFKDDTPTHALPLTDTYIVLYGTGDATVYSVPLPLPLYCTVPIYKLAREKIEAVFFSGNRRPATASSLATRQHVPRLLLNDS